MLPYTKLKNFNLIKIFPTFLAIFVAFVILFYHLITNGEIAVTSKIQDEVLQPELKAKKNVLDIDFTKEFYVESISDQGELLLTNSLLDLGKNQSLKVSLANILYLNQEQQQQAVIFLRDLLSNQKIRLDLISAVVPANLGKFSIADDKVSSYRPFAGTAVISVRPDRYNVYSSVVWLNNVTESSDKFKTAKKSQSVQELLLENGLAVVYFREALDDTNSVFLSEMESNFYRSEANARINNIGIWKEVSSQEVSSQELKSQELNSQELSSQNFYVLEAGSLEKNYRKYINHFVIVKGVVTGVYKNGTNVTLNFGNYFKRDFSVTMPKRIYSDLVNNLADYRLEKNSKKTSNSANMSNNLLRSDPLTSMSITVRGWLINENGPLIEIDNQYNLKLITME